MADVSIAGTGALAELQRRLGAEMPKQARRAVQLGVREAIQRTRKKGLGIAKKRYAFSKYGKGRVDSLLASKSFSPDKSMSEVRFKGSPGVPLRYFQTVPGRPSGNGRMPRLGGKTLRVRILRGGPMKPVAGPAGEKIFWWRHPRTGNVLLMYRAGRKIKSPDRMGASPIQAIQKQENFETIGEYLQETMMKRVSHQLDRMAR